VWQPGIAHRWTGAARGADRSWGAPAGAFKPRRIIGTCPPEYKPVIRPQQRRASAPRDPGARACRIDNAMHASIELAPAPHRGLPPKRCKES